MQTRSQSIDSEATVVIEGGFTVRKSNDDDESTASEGEESMTTEVAMQIAEENFQSSLRIYASLGRISDSLADVQRRVDARNTKVKEIEKENKALKKENAMLRSQSMSSYFFFHSVEVFIETLVKNGIVDSENKLAAMEDAVETIQTSAANHGMTKEEMADRIAKGEPVALLHWYEVMLKHDQHASFLQPGRVELHFKFACLVNKTLSDYITRMREFVKASPLASEWEAIEKQLTAPSDTLSVATEIME